MNPTRTITALAFALFVSSPALVDAAETAPLAIPSAWEYKDMNISDKGSLEYILNPLGREGWEVVAVIYTPSTAGGEGRIRIILKRPNKN